MCPGGELVTCQTRAKGSRPTLCLKRGSRAGRWRGGRSGPTREDWRTDRVASLGEGARRLSGEAWPMILRNLLRRKIRTALTAVGIGKKPKPGFA